jgi:hypothetical protein
MMDIGHWRSFAAALVVAGSTMVAPPAFAGLDGTLVSGVLNFGGGSTNFYDPANGFVPAGFGNSTSPNNVPIGGPFTATFGYMDGANTDNSNFTNTTLTFTDMVTLSGANEPIELMYTDTAFLGATVGLVSNNFAGITESLVSDVLTLSIPAADVTAGETFSAVYSITTAAVPAPVIGHGLLVFLAVGGVLFGGKLLEGFKTRRLPVA